MRRSIEAGFLLAPALAQPATAQAESIAEDASPAEWASTLYDRLSSGLRAVYDSLAAPRTAAETAPSSDEAANVQASGDSPTGHKANPFLPIFSVCGLVFVVAILAIHWHDCAERRRARRAAAGLPMDQYHGPVNRFVAACRSMAGSAGSRRAAHREARKQRRARLRALLRGAVGRVGQRLLQWRQTYNEKYSAPAGDGAALLAAAGAPSPAARRRSSASRYSMEDDIAQFRAAADVVGQMVSAEEGRCTAVAGAKQSQPRPDAARPGRPPRAPAYVHPDDVDDDDLAPPAYSP